MDMIAVCESLGAPLARRAGLEVDVLLGAQRLQDSIETLTRPSQPLTQPMDGNPIGAGIEAVIGGLELPSEGVGFDEPRALLLVVEPGAQCLAYGGVARRCAPSRGGTPVEIAIQALEEVVGQADTDDPRIVLYFFGHGFPSFPQNTTRCSTSAYCRVTKGRCQEGVFVTFQIKWRCFLHFIW